MYTLHISVAQQTLQVLKMGNPVPLHTYPTSTAAAGTGFKEGSNQTPLGKFTVHAVVGNPAQLGAVYKGRVQTHTHYTQHPGAQTEDLITTGLLWLSGLDAANQNTQARYIYIHGTQHEALLGTPASSGCIRTSNTAMQWLLQNISAGTRVIIE